MSASSRRSLPPVPRPSGERSTEVAEPATSAQPAGPAQGATAAGEAADAGQEFVARLRNAAPDFAAAAGAQSAVVREAVPPARHRRSRCRVVLRYADRSEADVTFLGPVGRPGAAPAGFDESILRWLGTGQRRETAWVVPDDDAADGTAVDLSAWLAAG